MNCVPLWIAPLLVALLAGCSCSKTPEPAPSSGVSTPAARERPGRDEPSHEESVPQAAASTESAAIDPASTGQLRVHVRFDGAAPARVEFDPTSDCLSHGSKILAEDVVVSGGALRDVVVYVKRGHERYLLPPPPSTPFVFDQLGCRYAPHVGAMRAGQTLAVHNADGTTHNVNWKSKKNPSLNRSQGAGARPIEGVFAHPELAIPLGCDLHTWMSAKLFVFEHPFFGVSDAAGDLTIEGLPAGDYDLGFWHESEQKKIALASDAKTVTIEAGATTTLELVYGPTK